MVNVTLQLIGVLIILSRVKCCGNQGKYLKTKILNTDAIDFWKKMTGSPGPHGPLRCTTFCGNSISALFDRESGTCYCKAKHNPESVTWDQRKDLLEMFQGKDCADLLKRIGIKQNGVYTIQPHDGGKLIQVYCDMTTDGGGWTVFQTRQDGSEDFYRGWDDYKYGFGQLTGEFWLGNDNLNRLTNQDSYQLRVEMEDATGVGRHALYEAFSIASEADDKYRLSIGGYSGNAGDSLGYHGGQQFSTNDRDNDVYSALHCARSHKGAWWYKSCRVSNLNGLYQLGKESPDGVYWNTFKAGSSSHPLKRTSMKFRPAGFKSK